jgi:hypothetical protein
MQETTGTNILPDKYASLQMGKGEVAWLEQVTDEEYSSIKQ